MAAAGAQRLQAGMRRPGTKPAILDHADGVSMLGWCPVGALYDGDSRALAHTTTHPPPSPRGQQKLQEGSGGRGARPLGEGQSGAPREWGPCQI